MLSDLLAPAGKAKSEPPSSQEFDKLGVRFAICVLGSSNELHRRIKVGEHVDFASWVLSGTVG